jgi:hypothetical protein
MDSDRLFLHVLDDLDRLRNWGDAASEYEALAISRLLRQLLLDAQPLVDVVNRDRRMRIRYRVNDRGVPRISGLREWAVLDGLDPDTAPPSDAVAAMTKDAMLRRPVMLTDGHEISAKELIKFHANVAGAVHAGEPQTDKEQALRAAHQSIGRDAWPMDVVCLFAIAHIVVKGLASLRERVRDETR